MREITPVEFLPVTHLLKVLGIQSDLVGGSDTAGILCSPVIPKRSRFFFPQNLTNKLLNTVVGELECSVW